MRVGVEYGSGKVLGDIGTETIQIGEEVVDSQWFILAQANLGFELVKADGIIGLGFPDMYSEHTSIVANMRR
jgi:hypothetical protein